MEALYPKLYEEKAWKGQRRRGVNYRAEVVTFHDTDIGQINGGAGPTEKQSRRHNSGESRSTDKFDAVQFEIDKNRGFPGRDVDRK